jgi:hypothetical protein
LTGIVPDKKFDYFSSDLSLLIGQNINYLTTTGTIAIMACSFEEHEIDKIRVGVRESKSTCHVGGDFRAMMVWVEVIW